MKNDMPFKDMSQGLTLRFGRPSSSLPSLPSLSRTSESLGLKSMRCLTWHKT